MNETIKCKIVKVSTNKKMLLLEYKGEQCWYFLTEKVLSFAKNFKEGDEVDVSTGKIKGKDVINFITKAGYSKAKKKESFDEEPTEELDTEETSFAEDIEPIKPDIIMPPIELDKIDKDILTGLGLKDNDRFKEIALTQAVLAIKNIEKLDINTLGEAILVLYNLLYTELRKV